METTRRLAIFRINYKSDFVLTLQSDAGWNIPFCIKFWTSIPTRAYYAGWDGTTYTHCAPVAGDSSKLQVQFDDHNLPIGELKYQIGYHFTVDDFPTTVEDEVINQGDVIIDNNGRNEKVLLDFNGETAPDIQFSLPAYANEAQRIENEEQRIANEEQRIENEQTRVGNEETRIVHEWERQRNEQTRITQEEARERAFTQMQRDSESATSAANDAATLANSKARLAQEKAEYAQQQGDFAKAQGETAQLDHTKAAGDHQTALADHQTAAADHQIAVADHQTAESDHTRAGQDHTDIQNAIAAADLVYDISKAHASGGVLATYADLSAALGTNGANVPVERRQGGMTVQFVRTSDNKYVQFRYMGTDVTTAATFTNVVNWQGVDTVPTANSKNLVKSGGVFSDVAPIAVEVTGQQSIRNADVHQVFPSTEYESAEGTRLRLVFEVKAGSNLIASCSLGKGVNVNLYNSVSDAILCPSIRKQKISGSVYTESISDTILYDGYLSVSLCKSDSTAFSYQEKQAYIAATTVNISGKSLKDLIDEVDAELDEKDAENKGLIDDINKRVLNCSLALSPSSYHNVEIKGLVPNHKYRLCFKNPGWDVTNVGDAYIFRLGVIYNNQTNYLVSEYSTRCVAKYYDFVVPSNYDSIKIDGRGNNITAEFTIVDITDTEKIGFVWESVEDAMYILRKVTSSGVVENNENGTRLRIIYYVPKGTKVAISTSDSSGIYVGLHPTLFNAVYGNEAIESYTSSTYQQSANGITSVGGYLNISMTNGNTAISDERQAEMLSSLNVFVGYGQELDILQQGVAIQELESDSVASNNKDMNDALVGVSRANNYVSGGYTSPVGEKKNLTIMAISDVHGTFNSISRAIEYSNAKKNYIDYNVCLGDVVLRSPSDSITDFVSSFANSERPFLFVVGNHDTADTGLAAITESQAKTKYFSKIVEKGWISNFKDTNSCSWYKDDSSYKIRFISVFEYGNSQEIASGAPGTYCRRWIPTDTLQWFADTLYSTPSDYSVVVLLHQAPYYPATYIDGKFTISSGIRPSIGGFFLNTVDGNPFGDIVNAYITGNSISQTYNSIASYGLEKTATVSKDFSQRGVGKFICYVAGHFHGSYVFSDATYSNQKTIVLPSGSMSCFQQQYGDTNYVADTRNQDQFYVIGFDTSNKLINIAKIGGQVTNDMVKRDIISVQY